MNDLIDSLTWSKVAWGAAIFIVSFVGSIALVTAIVVKLPANYFKSHEPPRFWANRNRVLRWLGGAGKNVAGAILVVAGAVMAIPGVPGQGILTMLIGLMLVDFPGRRRLEQRFVRRPAIRRTLDRIRARFGKPPFDLD